MPYTYSGGGGYTNSGSGGSFGGRSGYRDQSTRGKKDDDFGSYFANPKFLQSIFNRERGGFRNALDQYGGGINQLGQNTMGMLLGMPQAGQSGAGWSMPQVPYRPPTWNGVGVMTNPGSEPDRQRIQGNYLNTLTGGGTNADYVNAVQGNPNQMILESVLRNRNLGNRYQQVADRGLLGRDELASIGNMLSDANAATTGAYRQSAARNRQQMARGANTRQPGSQRALDNQLAGSLDTEAQMNAQLAGGPQRQVANLLSQSLMGGRQMGLAGMGQTNNVLNQFLANRGWDPSFENKFGESSARRAASMIPGAMMQGQMGLMDADLSERSNYMGNLLGRQNNTLSQFMNAFYQNQLADNAMKRQNQFGNFLQAGLGIGGMFGNPGGF